MTMKKKILTTLSVVLILGLAALGILAYLMDEDSDVNVMTLGNVSIDQIEQEWKDGSLVDFTQAKPLYPYVGNIAWEDRDADNGGAYRTFAMNNVVDKYVSVKNTGKSDAYVRTFIALEMGDYSYDEFNMVGISNNAENGSEFKFPGAWQWTDDFVANIDGKNYNVMVAVHKNPVKPGETTIPSLLQVYLSKDATNETVEKLDGNDNGTYDILVFSQAVQAEGFADAKTALNTAFGNTTVDKYHPWVDGVKIPVAVATADELSAALTAGEDVYLTKNIEGLDGNKTITIADGKNVELNLNGYTLSGNSTETGKNRSLLTVKGDLTVSNGTVAMEHKGGNMGWNNLVAAFSVEGGELTLNGVTINASGSDMTYGVDVNTTLGETVLNIKGNTSIASTYTAVRIFNNHKTAKGIVNLNSGTVNGTSRDVWAQKASSNSDPKNAIVNIADGYTYTVTEQESGGKIYQFN